MPSAREIILEAYIGDYLGEGGIIRAKENEHFIKLGSRGTVFQKKEYDVAGLFEIKRPENLQKKIQSINKGLINLGQVVSDGETKDIEVVINELRSAAGVPAFEFDNTFHGGLITRKGIEDYAVAQAGVKAFVVSAAFSDNYYLSLSYWTLTRRRWGFRTSRGGSSWDITKKTGGKAPDGFVQGSVSIKAKIIEINKHPLGNENSVLGNETKGVINTTEIVEAKKYLMKTTDRSGPVYSGDPPVLAGYRVNIRTFIDKIVDRKVKRTQTFFNVGDISINIERTSPSETGYVKSSTYERHSNRAGFISSSKDRSVGKIFLGFAPVGPRSIHTDAAKANRYVYVK